MRAMSVSGTWNEAASCGANVCAIAHHDVVRPMSTHNGPVRMSRASLCVPY